ncbi:MAG: drug/metabolite transporter (DMT)-like permease [Saprospiraceae bacterium]|jgi:drug/metabolite transporter (DMT)-like permease
MSVIKSEKGLIILAFAIIYIVWGSTYLANEYAIDSIPPWIMAGARFTIAGLLLFGFTRLKKIPLPSKEQLLNTWFLGLLFMTIGIGATVWAQVYVDSGFTALLIAANPLVVVLMLWFLNGVKPTKQSIFGIFLGILGMALLFSDAKIDLSGNAIWGIGGILLSIFAWAYGSVSILKMDLPDSKMQSAALQMLLGGGTLFFISFLSGDWNDFSFNQVTKTSCWAWIYLVSFGSIAAFTAFNYLLTKVSPEKVSTNTYVNPVIAIVLGWWLRDEPLTGQMAIAGLVMLVGVSCINSSKK